MSCSPPQVDEASLCLCMTGTGCIGSGWQAQRVTGLIQPRPTGHLNPSEGLMFRIEHLRTDHASCSLQLTSCIRT